MSNENQREAHARIMRIPPRNRYIHRSELIRTYGLDTVEVLEQERAYDLPELCGHCSTHLAEEPGDNDLFVLEERDYD